MPSRLPVHANKQDTHRLVAFTSTPDAHQIIPNVYLYIITDSSFLHDACQIYAKSKPFYFGRIYGHLLALSLATTNQFTKEKATECTVSIFSPKLLIIRCNLYTLLQL